MLVKSTTNAGLKKVRYLIALGMTVEQAHLFKAGEAIEVSSHLEGALASIGLIDVIKDNKNKDKTKIIEFTKPAKVTKPIDSKPSKSDDKLDDKEIK